jgi:hypothetical protein
LAIAKNLKNFLRIKPTVSVMVGFEKWVNTGMGGRLRDCSGILAEVMFGHQPASALKVIAEAQTFGLDGAKKAGWLTPQDW